tara:strand:- start:287 stop:973 length:687 start_codon:yes stop_codon:yes gene_type:complete
MGKLKLVDGQWVVGDEPPNTWITADLSQFTKTDSNSLLTAAGTTLGVESTLVLDGTNHGRIDSAMDGLFFTLQLTSFSRTIHYSVAIRAVWGNTLTGTWEMYLGVGNEASPSSNRGVYFSTQLDSSAVAGGNDYGATPNTQQSVTDARYLAGAVNYKSDRQDGSVGQVANEARDDRGGQVRSTDPANAMSSDAQFLMVGFGNQNTTDTQTLTGLKIQYQLLAHYGLDT